MCFVVFFFFCKMSAVFRGLFAVPFPGVGRLCSVTVSLPGHIQYYCSKFSISMVKSTFV